MSHITLCHVRARHVTSRHVTLRWTQYIWRSENRTPRDTNVPFNGGISLFFMIRYIAAKYITLKNADLNFLGGGFLEDVSKKPPPKYSLRFSAFILIYCSWRCRFSLLVFSFYQISKRWTWVRKSSKLIFSSLGTFVEIWLPSLMKIFNRQWANKTF